MTKIMYVGKHEAVDIPTLGDTSPGRIGRGQGADIDPALAAELLKTKDWQPAAESYAPVVATVAEAAQADAETAHLKLAAQKAKAYDPQASQQAAAEEDKPDVAAAATPVIDPGPTGTTINPS